MSMCFHFKNLTATSLPRSIECDIFRAAALDTWNRIGFIRARPRLLILETTITQNLVYELNLLRSINPRLRFTIFESTNEKVNGDDLEIKIMDSSGKFITFATQSKILYHNMPLNRGGKAMTLSDGRYKSMSHTVGKGKAKKNQIDLLLNYSKKNGCIPIYLLYNYVDIKIPSQTICGVLYDETQYGCSIISAQYLKTKHLIKGGNLSPNIKFSDLHPAIAKPWFMLPCCFPSMKVEDIVKEIGGGKIGYTITTESEEEVLNAAGWKLLSEPGGTSFNDRQTNKVNGENNFRPMYRIVINVSNSTVEG